MSGMAIVRMGVPARRPIPYEGAILREKSGRLRRRSHMQQRLRGDRAGLSTYRYAASAIRAPKQGTARNVRPPHEKRHPYGSVKDREPSLGIGDDDELPVRTGDGRFDPASLRPVEDEQFAALLVVNDDPVIVRFVDDETLLDWGGGAMTSAPVRVSMSSPVSGLSTLVVG